MSYRYVPVYLRSVPGAAAVMIMVIVAAVAGLSGCTAHRIHKSPWLVTESDANRYLTQALDHQNPDVRRDAIVRVSKTRYANRDTTVAACMLIAGSDPSQCVRSAAIRLLAESLQPAAAATLLTILEDSPSAGAGWRVRVDTLNALYFLVRNGAVAGHQADPAVATAARLLGEDPSRDVRIAAARLLGEFPHLEVPDALVSALHQEDFGVVYHAERSLIHLTGVTHHHDPSAWGAWLRSTDDPFAKRGQLDHTLQPPKETRWWQRLASSVKRAFTG